MSDAVGHNHARIVEGLSERVLPPMQNFVKRAEYAAKEIAQLYSKSQVCRGCLMDSVLFVDLCCAFVV